MYMRFGVDVMARSKVMDTLMISKVPRRMDGKLLKVQLFIVNRIFKTFK